MLRLNERINVTTNHYLVTHPWIATVVLRNFW